MKPIKYVTDFEKKLEKCYEYTRKLNVKFPDEYGMIYNEVIDGIEKMDCAENVRSVMRMRYRYGHNFTNIARLMGITYQWVYELHKNGVCLLEKHLSV